MRQTHDFLLKLGKPFADLLLTVLTLNRIHVFINVGKQPVQKRFFAVNHLIDRSDKCLLQLSLCNPFLRARLVAVQFVVITHPNRLLVFSVAPNLSVNFGARGVAIEFTRKRILVRKLTFYAFV